MRPGDGLMRVRESRCRLLPSRRNDAARNSVDKPGQTRGARQRLPEPKENNMPTSVSGKVCYIEIPARDIVRSADFYTRVFGWRTRTRGDGAIAFDDATGEVSGTWVTGRPSS